MWKYLKVGQITSGSSNSGHKWLNQNFQIPWRTVPVIERTFILTGNLPSTKELIDREKIESLCRLNYMFVYFHFIHKLCYNLLGLTVATTSCNQSISINTCTSVTSGKQYKKRFRLQTVCRSGRYTHWILCYTNMQQIPTASVWTQISLRDTLFMNGIFSRVGFCGSVTTALFSNI